MKIKVKDGKKYIHVDVSDKDCPKRKCFGYHKFLHYSTSIDGANSSWQDKEYSCPHRNYHGCPNPKPEIDMKKRKGDKNGK